MTFAMKPNCGRLLLGMFYIRVPFIYFSKYELCC